jgi:DNA segregation ATPase FtsK/SpoIIIE, S-DNA-T family
VTEEQRREIVGVALLAVALFFVLALVPVAVFGARGEPWFPSSNMMGPTGGVIRALLVFVFGVSSVFAPIALAIGGLRAGHWLSPEQSLRLALLSTGLLLLIPILAWIVGAPEAAGWIGQALGAPLVGLLGPLGAGLVAAVALVALSVGTLGWNPLRSLAQGMVAGGDAAGRTARVLAERSRELAERGRGLAAARSERATLVEEAAVGLPGLAPEWLGQEAPGDEGVLPDAAEDVRPAPAEPRAPEGAIAPRPTAEPEDALEPTPARGRDRETAEGGDEDGQTVADEGPLEFGHEMPPVDLLSAPEHQDRESMDRQLDQLGRILVEKLRTFNVQCEIGGRTTGPMVTQFEVVPAPGVKVNRIANLDADLALAMKAHAIRIVAPIPGKGAVGVEIPNPRPEMVNLREILESQAFRNAKGELPLALGKDLTGRPYVTTLEAMPHVLIAGATGSGKSVCLNTIVTSLVYKHTPETLRLLMIDPKMVELSVYSRLPHLRHNVVTDPRDAAGVLKWAVLEMGRRYALLKANHVRSIQEFNRKVRAGKPLKRHEPKGPEGDQDRWTYKDGVLPYIVVVVDELADLMMTVQAEVEKPLTQLAQKARAIGIHLIVATQRPSVNVITGLIKANFPTRIAFRVASKTDSRTILDQNGADALLGNGDMLFLPPGRSDPVRIQGAYLPTEDTERLMSWYIELLERRGMPETPEEREALETDILEELQGQELEAAASAAEDISGDWDELFRAAAEICIQNGGGSTSLLQRRLSIGYGRAARIVDQLFDAGVLGPSDGAKGREVLMGMDELDAMLPGGGPRL